MSWAIEEKGYSQRRACGLIGLEPKTYRYASTRGDDAAVRVRLHSLAGERRRFGYRRLLILLRREGLTLNHKKLFRSLPGEAAVGAQARWAQTSPWHAGPRRRAAGAEPALEPRLRLRHARRRAALPHPRRGRRLHAGVLALVVDTSLSGHRVARELDRIIAGRGKPLMIVFRQRHRTDLARHPALAGRACGRVALHRPRKAAAERLR